VALVRFHGRAELEVDRFVAGEERQVPVSGGARDDFQMAVAGQLGEGTRDVATDAPVQLPHALVEVLPEVGDGDDGLLVAGGEVLATLHGRAPRVLVIEGQLLLAFGRGELLAQDGRDVDRPLRGDAVVDEVLRRLQQGQVAFEDGFVQPVRPVGPASVIDHHRKMGMEDQ